MAKGIREKIKLVSSAGTGHFYTTTKNKRTKPEKLELKSSIQLSVSTFYTKKLKSNNFRFLVKKTPPRRGFLLSRLRYRLHRWRWRTFTPAPGGRAC